MEILAGVKGKPSSVLEQPAAVEVRVLCAL